MENVKAVVYVAGETAKHGVTVLKVGYPKDEEQAQEVDGVEVVDVFPSVGAFVSNPGARCSCGFAPGLHLHLKDVTSNPVLWDMFKSCVNDPFGVFADLCNKLEGVEDKEEALEEAPKENSKVRLKQGDKPLKQVKPSSAVFDLLHDVIKGKKK